MKGEWEALILVYNGTVCVQISEFSTLGLCIKIYYHLNDSKLY